MVILQALNDILYLIVKGEDTENDEGFLAEEGAEERKEIFCKKQSVKMAEYYESMRAGVRLTDVFIVSAHDYGKERHIEHDGSRYKVERTYRMGENYLELMCREVLHGKV